MNDTQSYLSFILRQIWSFAYIVIGYILAAFTGGGKLCCCEILIMLGLIAAFVWIPNKLIPTYIKKRYSGSK